MLGGTVVTHPVPFIKALKRQLNGSVTAKRSNIHSTWLIISIFRYKKTRNYISLRPKYDVDNEEMSRKYRISPIEHDYTWMDIIEFTTCEFEERMP